MKVRYRRTYFITFAAIIFSLASITAGAQTVNEPELPRTWLDTTFAAPAGNLITVASGGNFQAALDAANPGDTIVLQAGATFSGNFSLPFKSGSAWIVI